MKKCKECSIEKPLEEFANEKRNKDGKIGTCKECTKKKNENRLINYIVPYSTKKCKECSIEKPLEDFRAHNRKKDGRLNNCRECMKEKEKIKRKVNPTPITEYSKQYKRNYARKFGKRNYERDREVRLEKQKKYQKDNLEKRVEYLKTYSKKRRQEDPLYRFIQATRSNITQSFIKVLKESYKGKRKRTEQILGMRLEEFVCYIESLFLPGMTLENYGEWELDHIIPISSAKTEEEAEKLCHYTNFQPLWWLDNVRKSNKILTEYE